MSREEHTGADDPHPLAEGLERVLARLGTRGAEGVVDVFARWDELVGPLVAENIKPLSVRNGELLLVATDSTWAAQMRWLEAELIERITAEGGPRLQRVQVRVRRR